MLSLRRVLFGIGFPCLLAVNVQAQSAPVVSNVVAGQRQDFSGRVDIHYSLTAARPCTVWIAASADGGANSNVPVLTFSGDIGPSVNPGTNKSIVWDAGADLPGKTGSFRIRVYADDGSSQAQMVLVPGGNFPYQNGAQIYVGPFWIDKYEMTNARYCEFLNAADPDGNHWDPQQEIVRTGQPPNVVYAVKSGRGNYPVRFVSTSDADAMAAWLTQREGRTHRLPTSQEWEKAAAWDTSLQKRWSYGFLNNNVDCSWANFNNCIGLPTEVGSYNGIGGNNDAHSFFGAYDMSGNVWEWTTYGGDRVLRGGMWASGPGGCNSTIGLTMPGSYRFNDVGFRLVLDSN